MTLLTERQHDCLYWAAQGKTSWEIGCILGISERTANFHISNTCDKLAVRTRQAAITAAANSRERMVVSSLCGFGGRLCARS